ncbi:single-stranded DNA-binding protein [Erysipelothrix sp. HDW6C]|uniref:single-stranded DNA-binding protein n=1 Tax=Erysipelothrix sp. HDW6C TaxID=2714930 RepID=UPI00140A5028|nr:single-stranded DNA-binding protein [Erysipelothrix sp. HDW6C]QIK70717.1 single-stranded DNA-binding protein [Erysipelothrix sp. HDW6C]
MNNVGLVGTIYKEMRYIEKKGDIPSFISFKLRVFNYFDKKKNKEMYSYIPCSASDWVANHIHKYFKSGSAIIINDAKIVNNNWEDKDGNKHYDLVVSVSGVQFPVTDYKEQPVQPKPYSTEVNEPQDETTDYPTDEEFAEMFGESDTFPF